MYPLVKQGQIGNAKALEIIMFYFSGRSKLISTFEERSVLAHKLFGAYNASLKTDREKAFDRVREQDNQKILIELMNSTKERVLPEPILSEPHVVISVRNPCTCKLRFDFLRKIRILLKCMIGFGAYRQ